MSLEAHGLPLLPLRPAIFAFTMDEHGFTLICDIIDYWQKHYGMTLAESVELLNVRLGARPAEVTADSIWFSNTMEHIAREMVEGMYWVKKDKPG
jgi:hypothetical protein